MKRWSESGGLRRAVRRGGALLIAVVIAGAVGRPTVAAQDEPESGTPAVAASGVEGDSYASPTHGYTVAWDAAVWQPVADEEEVEAGAADLDRLVLANEAGRLTIEGFAGHGGDAGDCEIAAHDAARDAARVSAFDRVRDADEDALPGGFDIGYSVVFTRTIAADDGKPVDEVGYVECHPLVDGRAVLRITYLGDPLVYDGEEPRIRAVIASMTLTGGTDDEGTPAPAAKADSGEGPNAGVEGRTYTSSEYGFTLSWGEEWHITAPLSDAATDIDLSNGTSNVHVSAFEGFEGDAEVCLASLGFTSSVTRAVREPDALPADPAPGSAYRLAIVTSTDAVSGYAEDRYEYVECRAFEPGRSVLVIQVLVPVAVMADAEEFDKVRELLAGLVVPG